MGQFKAVTYDELFEATKSLPWERYIPQHGKFWVAKANSIKSKLFSPSDIQSIMKKAIVERLKEKYKVEWFPEDGEPYPIRVSLLKDVVTVGLDTTGTSLHKRGYRQFTAKAPITETLASALLMLTPWKADRILVDPFCGSGTFCIEAAMMAADMAPGIHRSFLSEEWKHLIPERSWSDVREEAEDRVRTDVQTDIQGYDIDREVVGFARENAKLAGVDHMIHFQQRPVSELSHPGKYGFIVTNPPYGERLEEKRASGALQNPRGTLCETGHLVSVRHQRLSGRRAIHRQNRTKESEDLQRNDEDIFLPVPGAEASAPQASPGIRRLIRFSAGGNLQIQKRSERKYECIQSFLQQAIRTNWQKSGRS